MNLRVGDHNPRPRRILDRELRFPSLPTQPPNGQGQMLPSQRLDILNLKRLDVKLVQSEHSDGIRYVEAEHERVHKVRTLLQIADVGGVGTGFELDPAGFEVHPDVYFHFFVNWSVAVWGDGNFAGLGFPIRDFVRF
ncbi:hypothetical protein Pfo_007904 [Paulownia fortunei]|nr:hypothetical protein Pfo_007904 [Paulownia fortunei]